MVFRLHMRKQAEKTSGKRKKQATSGKNKRKSRSKESGAAPFSVL